MSEISKLNGYDLKDKKAKRFYDSISDMKSDETLKDGMFVETKGYYSINDGGLGKYVIVDDSTLVEDGGSIIALDNELFANLLIEDNTVNVKQFGAYGDGIHNDTESIQNAINIATNVYIPDGIYMIDPETSILLISNRYIRLSENATLKSITSDSSHYAVLKIDDVDNVTIEGGTIQGERDTHIGDDGQWGMGIRIAMGSENIKIKNITLKDCWGDGLYIGNGKHITTENIICDNNRRQGLSIISVEDYHSINDKFINTNGSNPRSGVDIEPNYDNQLLKNIVFDNPYTANNEGHGILIQVRNLETDVDIKINNHYDDGSTEGLGIAKQPNSKGNIIINGCSLYNNGLSGLHLRDCFYSPCKVIINNPHVENCNTSNNASGSVGCISIFTNDENTYPLGNIIINNPYLTQYNKIDSRRAIFINDQTNQEISEDITINNILYKESNLRVGGGVINGFIFKDEYNQCVYDKNYSPTVSVNDYYSLFQNTVYESSRTITLSPNLCIGNEITFRKTNNRYNMDIQFPDDQYCRLFDNDNAAPKIRLGNSSSITIKKINTTDWIVTNMIGTATLQ